VSQRRVLSIPEFVRKLRALAEDAEHGRSLTLPNGALVSALLGGIANDLELMHEKRRLPSGEWT